MKYDLFAEFYENSSEKPRYVVWMGSIYPKTLNEMESMGFQERLNDGYLDYVKENVTEKDLEELTQPGFECELMDVIDELDMIDDPDEVYNERVKIIATELDVIDDEGNYPEMEYMVGNTMVRFFDSSTMCPVLFRRLPDCVDKFMISVIKLKRHFKVLTLMEVIEALQAMNEEKEWTFEQLKELFYKKEGEPRVIEQKIEPILLEDLIAVAVDGKSILFVRDQDKENVQAVGAMVETDNSMCCQFGLVQHFLKFRMMDIIQDKAELHEFYRTRIVKTFQPAAIYNLETEFRHQLESWDTLDDKWDFGVSEVFDCEKPDKRKIVYVDMDDVLVDFDSAVKLQSDEVLAQYNGRYDEIPGIFGMMKPMKGAIEAIDKLKEHFDMYILSTAPWENPSAWKDKVMWVEKYFGQVFYKRLILSHHKNLCKGDYLIDDRTKNGAGEFEGELIRFGNNEFPNWERVLAYLLKKV